MIPRECNAFWFLGVSLHKTFFLQYIHIYIYIYFKEQVFKNLMMQEWTMHSINNSYGTCQILCVGVICVLVSASPLSPHKSVAQSCPTLCTSMNCRLPGSSDHGDSLGKNTGVGCCALLQGPSQPRDRTQISCIAADSLPSEPPGKPNN